MRSTYLHSQDESRSLQIRVRGSVVSITSAGEGMVQLRGGRQEVVAALRQYIAQSAFDRAWTKSDLLRIARRLAKKFKAEILHLDGVLADIRAGWVRLLQAHLLPDPGHSYGSHQNEFHTVRWLSVEVKGRRKKLLRGGPADMATFYLGDAGRLEVSSQAASTIWSVRWEDITRVSFSYWEPPRSGGG